MGIPNIRDRVVHTPVKRLLEPLFKAGFEPDSNGFRPQRGAHDALNAIRGALQTGMRWVIDADVTAYFDTIPHDRLMKSIAERVVDSALLALVKRFLEAPVVDARDGGRPQRLRQGSPLGGVISPLLANVYLHLVDRIFRTLVHHGALRGRLVRYADDLILLAPRCPDRELAWLTRVLGRLGLALHPQKSRVLDARREAFVFLGHTHHWRKGRVYLDVSAPIKPCRMPWMLSAKKKERSQCIINHESGRQALAFNQFEVRLEDLERERTVFFQQIETAEGGVELLASYSERRKSLRAAVPGRASANGRSVDLLGGRRGETARMRPIVRGLRGGTAGARRHGRTGGRSVSSGRDPSSR